MRVLAKIKAVRVMVKGKFLITQIAVGSASRWLLLKPLVGQPIVYILMVWESVSCTQLTEILFRNKSIISISVNINHCLHLTSYLFNYLFESTACNKQTPVQWGFCGYYGFFPHQLYLLCLTARKWHRNGIKKPKKKRQRSMKGVGCLLEVLFDMVTSLESGSI